MASAAAKNCFSARARFSVMDWSDGTASFYSSRWEAQNGPLFRKRNLKRRGTPRGSSPREESGSGAKSDSSSLLASLLGATRFFVVEQPRRRRGRPPG